MRRMLGAILATCSVLAGGWASAQSLWGSTEYGMSVDDARRSVENAVNIKDSPPTESGAVELLRVRDVDVFGSVFSARLIFKNEQLVQVSLSPEEMPSEGDAERLYRNISEGLTMKYGASVSNNDGKSPFLTMKTWVNGKTNITASIMTKDGKVLYLGLAYQLRLYEGAKNL